MRKINEITEYLKTAEIPYNCKPRKIKSLVNETISRLYANEEITTVIIKDYCDSANDNKEIYFFTDLNRLIITTEKCLTPRKALFKNYGHTALEYDFKTVNSEEVYYNKIENESGGYAEIVLSGNNDKLNRFEITITVDKLSGEISFNAIKMHFSRYGN